MDDRIVVNNFSENFYCDLKSQLECGDLLARILASRFDDLDYIRDFLHPDLERDWGNPYEIAGMKDVADVVERHLRAGSRILVYGDYDLDGISATTVIVRGLELLCAHVATDFALDTFLPNRLTEGYGITDASVSRLTAEHEKPDLIITVDCGISCKEEITRLVDAGVDVVVTDHHEAECERPSVPWVDPKASGDSAFACLAGVGVALKLVQALSSRFGLPAAWEQLCDIATLGTIADVMPLTGCNRALVAHGVDIINKKPRACLSALFAIANKGHEQAGNVSAIDLSFSVVPRLNSAGRMGQADVGLRLLLSDDVSEVQGLAEQLESTNNERRSVSADIVEICEAQASVVLRQNPQTRALFLHGPGWHVGVLGIVAARIADKFGLPAFIISESDGVGVASVRSVGDVDLYSAIVSAADLLVRFGGHAHAAGLTVEMKNLSAFEKAIGDFLAKLPAEQFVKKVECDCNAFISELDLASVEELGALEPCGKKNPAPVVCLPNVFVRDARAVGADKTHLSCTFSDGFNSIKGIAFSCKNIDEVMSCEGLVRVAARPVVEQWRGYRSVKLYVEEIEILRGQEDDYRDEGAEDAENASKLDDQDIDDLQERQSLSPKDKAAAREHWEQIAATDAAGLQRKILDAIIGEDGQLHESQQRALDTLSEGKSAIAIMPTGRGKSLIFQVYGAMAALAEHKMSVFVYPLRALIADQAFHLQNFFDDFGLTTCVLNGETPTEERQRVCGEMEAGRVDIVLTTPEYLDIHVTDFAEHGKVGFLVIDECHHIGEVKVGQRTAYGNLPGILQALGNPQVLALSATVSSDTYEQVEKYLPQLEIITDNFERSNLHIDDKRNIAAKDDFMVALVASGQKTVIYANSRETTIALTRLIRRRAPHIAMQVGFYNAGMSKAQRKETETRFRDDELSCLIATSAFGEGVNIPDIRHVILYHLPFSEVEFNQMSGRAGRDGLPAVVHLVYSEDDAAINTGILSLSNPARDELGRIYLWLKAACGGAASAGDDGHISENLRPGAEDGSVEKPQAGCFSFGRAELDQWASDGALPAEPSAIMCAVAIFAELGLVKIETAFENGQNISKITFEDIDPEKKVQLEDSSRFVEGQNQIVDFENYRDMAVKMGVEELTEILRHPITPSVALA